MNADVERQIASLALDGITQVTADELKVMTPEQMVRAREQGRLIRLMNTPRDTAGHYRQHAS